MRAYRIESFGSVDGIALGERPDPRPGTRELLGVIVKPAMRALDRQFEARTVLPR
jgi:hypothetical protein